MSKKKQKVTEPPAEQVTHAVIVLDKSGSMDDIREATVTGLNEEIQQLRMNGKTQNILCSLVTFDGFVYEHFWEIPASELQDVPLTEYVPSGGTAMRDALGYTIQRLRETTDYQNKNHAYYIVTISDGKTEHDRRFSIPALRETMEPCHKSGRWTFRYVGCSAEVLQEVHRQTSIPLGNMAVWSAETPTSASFGFARSAEASKRYFSARSVGVQALNCCDSGQVGKFADYTMGEAKVAPEPVLTEEQMWNRLKSPHVNAIPLIMGTPSKAENGFKAALDNSVKASLSGG